MDLLHVAAVRGDAARHRPAADPRSASVGASRSRRPFSSAVCAVPAIIDAALSGGLGEIGDGLEEYVAFIALISALYVTAGGIHISGNPRGTPLINTTFLAIGAVAASLIGTTGASMLLIRPLLDANRERKLKTHIVVFFILIVSNSGGLLTPLGDPPLYLGYLNGVPFFFTAAVCSRRGCSRRRCC